MHQGKKFLALIPARSGSKRLPNKNIKNLYGKPLIAWSIEAGLKSKYIDEVVVSTDSQEYADIAISYGAQVPCLRPSELSLDTTPTFEVIEHMINYYHSQLCKTFDYIILLQPTSPFRPAYIIDEMCKWIIYHNYSSGISVSECRHPPLWSNTLPKNKSMKDFFSPETLNKRSQELPKYYQVNGVLYIAKLSSLLHYKSFYSSETFAYNIDQKFAIDIDTNLDFEYAEFIINKYIQEL